jgi:hypothetical protein
MSPQAAHSASLVENSSNEIERESFRRRDNRINRKFDDARVRMSGPNLVEKNRLPNPPQAEQRNMPPLPALKARQHVVKQTEL